MNRFTIFMPDASEFVYTLAGQGDEIIIEHIAQDASGRAYMPTRIISIDRADDEQGQRFIAAMALYLLMSHGSPGLFVQMPII